MKRSVVLILGVCAALATSADEARAQMTFGTFKGYLTGHIGVVSGGDVTSERTAAGASVGVYESNGWGAEIDFGRATDVAINTHPLNLTSYMVNAGWVKPSGVLRPFAGAGAGIMQVDGCGSPCGSSSRTYDLGMSVGGGAVVAVNEYVGFRADARYLVSFADHPELARPDNLRFWRLSVGATFMWVIVP
jgi:opacity protein-like surface antigen